MAKPFLLVLILMLTACAPMHSYDASIQGPNGRYDIVGRRGALIEAKFTDGSEVRVDDRGHPDQPGAFSNAASLAAVALANRNVD